MDAEAPLAAAEDQLPLPVPHPVHEYEKLRRVGEGEAWCMLGCSGAACRRAHGNMVDWVILRQGDGSMRWLNTPCVARRHLW